MKGTILLNYNENTHQVEEEEKARFLRALIEQIFDNTEVLTQVREIWTEDGLLSPEQKVKMRGIFTTYGIQVIDDRDGHMQVYVEGELVGEWHKCTYKLKRDIAQRDPKKKLYLEMEVNCWSVFDSQLEQEIE
jgi:hypothetical protein